jgi:hypothetical protein
VIWSGLRIRPDPKAAPDHDDLGSTRSKLTTVIDSEGSARDAGETTLAEPRKRG